MRALVATDQTDPRDGGFSYTVPGELLTAPPPCDKFGCGCRWSFNGLSSTVGTTLALVVDRPDIDPATFAELVGDPWVSDVAAEYPPGTVLVRWVPRGDDEQVMPLDEWVDTHGMRCRPEDA